MNMAVSILNQLNTTQLAEDFNDFLTGLGLGDMEPSTADRHRQDVEVSPMDDILALNGFDLNELFKKRHPKPDPLEILGSITSETGDSSNGSQVSDGISAVQSLGLSGDALKTIISLLQGIGNTSVEQLPDGMSQLLLSNPGISSAAELILQLGELYKLIGDRALPPGKDLTELMFDMMKDLNTNDSSILLKRLKENPLSLMNVLDDSITGISTPLGHTSILLSATDPFNNDPITGTSESETLLASRAGGSMLIGGGGRDFYVIPLSTSPFAQSTSISDFDRASGSKIVLDTTDYTKKLGSRFKTAKSDRAVKKLARSKATFIFKAKTNELLLNGNGRARGLGPTNGGVIAIFENKTTILANDLLTFDGNSLRQLNGSEFFA